MDPQDYASTRCRTDGPSIGQAPAPSTTALIACTVWVVALTAVFMSFYFPPEWLELPIRIAIAALHRLRDTVYPLVYRNYVL